MCVEATEIPKIYESLKRGELYKFWGPRTVEIEVTNKCNMRCKMCSRWAWKNQGSNLDINTIKRLVLEIKTLGGQNILLSGGEPLLREDFAEIVNKIQTNGLNIILFTNGTLMTEELADKLSKGNTKFVFSIDSAIPEFYERIRGVKGSWKLATRGLKFAVDMNRKNGHKSRVGINFTTQKDNVQTMLETVKFSEENGVDYIRFGLVHGQDDVGLSESEMKGLRSQILEIRKKKDNMKLEIFGSQYFKPLIRGDLDIKAVSSGFPALKLFKEKPVPCYVCSQFMLIDSFGDVFPCTYHYLDNDPDDLKTQKIRAKNKIGNIFEKSIKQIWEGEKYREFRKNHNPVNIERDGRTCGQCEHYFQFAKMKRFFDSLKRRGIEKTINDSAWCGCDASDDSI